MAEFTYGPANVNSLMTTTLQNYRPKLMDNIYTGIPVLRYFLDKKRITTYPGGRVILEPLMYEKNSTAQFQSTTAVVNTTLQEGLTQAAFPWKLITATIGITNHEKLVNRQEWEILNLLEARTLQAELAIKEKLAKALFSTSVGTDDFDSIARYVDSSGTVGDIASGAYTWWQSTETTSGSFAAQGVTDMRTLYHTISKSLVDPPDLGVTTQTVYEYYENTLTPQVRYDLLANKGVLDAGAGGLKFKGVTLMFDENCNSGVLYFINTKYLKFVMHSDDNFKTGPFIQPENQLVSTAIISATGNLTINQRARQGKLVDITA